ncbi:MAG: outer membrane protein assembly factor BamD [Blastocatellia bacterium]|nr:outer membrane protein assembly factor BamD [Blastocatellia bacterium]MCS7156983.1 outer membrane protein assembly factor BamD [Blastocatellia bacterium]MCX7752184.1 outer membrane protein assembly factor BamD [Blastocatellia bacterium]MDW8167676.1 outer membrane protein assembly factor BamD [Acidobacteriota bacterium]MDW8256275.1 outer membrane protein assembly factor BamD [Acidobacteriota bacterium]
MWGRTPTDERQMADKWRSRKRSFKWIALLLGVGLVGLSPLLTMRATPQGNVSRGPLFDPRNPELERAARHDLEVARFYIKRKKWKAAEGRLQAIVRDHPAFSRIAEVYFLLGEVYRQTGRRDLAIELYSRVIEEFPMHELAEQARERLRSMGASPSKGG